MKNLSKRMSKHLVLMSIVILSFVSCGKQGSRVTDVNVSTRYLNSDVYLGVAVEWNMGNIMLPQISLPVYLPQSNDLIGKFEMSPILGQKSMINIEVNLTQAYAKIQAEEAKLPNGSLIPLIGSTRTISIPIKDKVVIYLTIGDGVAAIGLAANIAGMDALGAQVGNATLFPVFAVKNVVGSAGLYTSKRAGENGIGFIVDLSNVLEESVYFDIGAASVSKSFGPNPVGNAEGLKLISVYPSKSKEKALNKALYNMHKSKKQLRF